MYRFLRFKLRTLLVGLTLTCLALGAWRLYCRPYITVEPRANERFIMRCRLLQLRGPASVPFELLVIRTQRGGEVVYKQIFGSATRIGWGRYDAKYDFSLRAPRGNYRVLVKASGLAELETALIIADGG